MKTYYNDTLRKVTFENKSVDVLGATDYFKVLSDHKESYIGFIDVYDDVIIFKWVSKDKWLIDHPVVPDTLHRQRYATTEECLVFIEKVHQEYDISGFNGFEDVPIKEFTLDEMLVFKAEDEALLREEELPTEMSPISEPIKQQKQLSTQPKKNQKQSFVIGKQLGSKKSPSSPTPIDSKPIHANSKKTKPSDDTSFFQL
ncbi:hypothetical protein [Aquimarina aggregata]|uniref:hypothetical protein n=1 Tax=Aquimarina aggregata TaxID=1642818 RepID=UPI0024938A1E|nr:hypothetical protein [Aquimarina aggregata]